MADHLIPPIPGVPTQHMPQMGHIPTGSLNGGGWQFPDYTSLLNQWMNPYQNLYNSSQQQALAWLNSQSQIAQNRFNQGDTSTMARLKDTHEQALQGIVNSLAARGILHSGENKYQTGLENERYKRAEYDASNQLLDYLSGLQQQYALNQQSALGGLINQQTGLASQLAGIYQPYYNFDPYSFPDVQPGATP